MKIANPTGVLGEDIAVNYLKKKGYKIIERNFRKKYTEVDIIAVQAPPRGVLPRCGSTLVFIEVKTRRSGSFGDAAESVTSWKVRHLVQLAQFYKQTHQNLPDDMRIDLIAVTLGSNNRLVEVEHIENISGF
jgi:putative endonuclease